MIRIMVVLVAIALAGCESAPVRDSADVRSSKLPDQGVVLPAHLAIAFYVEKDKPDEGVNFFGPLEKAAGLVAKDTFTRSEKLTPGSNFQYLLRFGAVSDWRRYGHSWNSEVTLRALDASGKTVFTSKVKKSASGVEIYDFDAVQDSLARAVKELMIEFLNANYRDSVNGGTKIAELSVSPPDLKQILKDVAPGSSGTGFYINEHGDVATAAHVVDGCFYVEVVHGGDRFKGRVLKTSRLLDLAVVGTGAAEVAHARLPKSVGPKLGKQVFVSGFPLSGILADSPSLTIGIVSSMGGLKGSKGHFQFSAQVQPGNSGGPVVDYDGNVLGVVSSTLNQKLLLEKSGVTSQNVNFGVSASLLRKFMDKNGIRYDSVKSSGTFDKASADAVGYTNQVLCYR